MIKRLHLSVRTLLYRHLMLWVVLLLRGVWLLPGC